jgi:hypothetical protein
VVTTGAGELVTGGVVGRGVTCAETVGPGLECAGEGAGAAGVGPVATPPDRDGVGVAGEPDAGGVQVGEPAGGLDSPPGDDPAPVAGCFGAGEAVAPFGSAAAAIGRPHWST